MSKTYKTDPWDVKEARGVAWNPREFRRERSCTPVTPGT